MKKIYKSNQEIVDAAYSYLESHLESGERWGKQYFFYKPANSKYGAHQWLWDSGWHMIVWSRRNPEYAIKDLRCMLQFQQKNGFIPEMIFWGKKQFFEKLGEKWFGYSRSDYTDISQMPMLGYSLRAIYEATQNIDILKEFTPKLVHYLEWWHNERDPDQDGLISIIHPWESGLDASPLYDPAHNVKNPTYRQLYPKFLKLLRTYRKQANWNISHILEKGWFNFEDVGVCAVYADNWNILARLADKFDTELAARCRKFYELYEKKIIEKCWDPSKNQFISFYHQDGKEKTSFIETIQSLFPLLLENLPKEIHDQLILKIIDPEKFGTKYPIPSTAKSEETFNPLDSRLMWRGPTWGPTTWFIIEGLLKHGDEELANQILDRWIEMVQYNGLYEYYNPLTGEAEGQEGLGMATTIVDLLHRMKKL